MSDAMNIEMKDEMGSEVAGVESAEVGKEFLAKDLAKRSGGRVSEWLAYQLVGHFVSSIKENCQEGKKVIIRGFGTFSEREVAAYTQKNNAMTGKDVEVPAKRYLCFKRSKLVRREVK